MAKMKIGTMLQVGRSRVRYQVKRMNFLQFAQSSYRSTALGFTQPLTEMSTRSRNIFLGNEVLPVRRADNLTAICEPTLSIMWAPHRIGLHGLALLFSMLLGRWLSV
jgi:hypothetical protein